MALLSKSGIGTGNTIQSSHITNIYDALNGSGSYEIVATGSFSGTFDGAITSASFASTASFVTTAQTASYVLSSVSASRSTSSSFATLAATATTASYIVNAQTASFVATAQTASYVLNSVSASFANTAMTSSYIVTAQTASYVLNSVSASFSTSSSFASTSVSTSFATIAQTASYIITAQTASFVNTAQTASYILNSVSASFASTASIATSASFATSASLYAGYYGVTYSPSIITTGSKQYYPEEFTLPLLGNPYEAGTQTRSAMSFKIIITAMASINSNSYIFGGSHERQQITYSAMATNNSDGDLIISYISSSMGNDVAICGLEQGSASNKVKFWVDGRLHDYTNFSNYFTVQENTAHVSIQYNSPLTASYGYL